MISIALNLLLILAELSIPIAANALLALWWYNWSQGSFGDCPNYAFSLTWYPEPPLLVTSIPLAIATFGIVFFIVRLSISRRAPRTLQTSVNVIGLTLSCSPVIAALIIPIISELLQLSKADC